jgi:AraC-like DNA-binding protein
MYREYAPPRALAEFVECFWQRRLLDRTLDPTGAVFPDGRVDVLWSADGQMIVAGPATRSLPRVLTAPFAVVGARFHPGVGPALLGLPANELVDSYVPLASLDSRSAGALCAGLGTAEDAGQAVSAMAERIARLGGDTVAVDPLVRAAVRRLDRAGTRVSTLGPGLGISERQLQRRFRDAVGYGPKTLQRILRFQRALAEIRRGLRAIRRARAGGRRDGLRRSGALDAREPALGGLQPEAPGAGDLSSSELEAPVGPQHRKGPHRAVAAPFEARLRRVAREIDLPTSV